MIKALHILFFLSVLFVSEQSFAKDLEPYKFKDTSKQETYLMKAKSFTYISTVTGEYMGAFFECNEKGKEIENGRLITFNVSPGQGEIAYSDVKLLIEEFTTGEKKSGEFAGVLNYVLKNDRMVYRVTVNEFSFVSITSLNNTFNWKPTKKFTIMKSLGEVSGER